MKIKNRWPFCFFLGIWNTNHIWLLYTVFSRIYATYKRRNCEKYIGTVNRMHNHLNEYSFKIWSFSLIFSHSRAQYAISQAHLRANVHSHFILACRISKVNYWCYVYDNQIKRNCSKCTQVFWNATESYMPICEKCTNALYHVKCYRFVYTIYIPAPI